MVMPVDRVRRDTETFGATPAEVLLVEASSGLGTAPQFSRNFPHFCAIVRNWM